MKLAAYDIGTNSIHMLIVEIREDLSFEILGHEKDPARLGDGSFETGRLSKKAMKRSLEALARFQKIAKKSGVDRSIAVATSAVREAKNSGEFLRQVKRLTGLNVKVITGEEEARLIFLAARSSVETRGGRMLVVDIGGGSMELVLGDAKGHGYLESFKLGVARLSDRFLGADPPSKKDLQRLEEHVRETLQTPAKRVRKEGFDMVVGTAGTMIALASLVHQAEERSPLDSFHHYELSRKGLEKVQAKLARTTLKDRLRLPGLDPKRADLIVAGSTLVLETMRLLRIKRITISEKGIREGILLDYIERNRKSVKPAEDSNLGIREKSVRQLARRCSSNQAHAEHVTRLALELFDKTRALHGLGEREKEILRYASLLHDIGHSISFRKHHKHSQYLIENSDLNGFTPKEIQVMALIALQHRKPVKKKAGRFLGKNGKYTVSALGSLLRIADGLDRSHFGVVDSFDCRIFPDRMVLQLYAKKDAELEVWSAGERADLFEHLFGRRVVVQTAPPKRR